MKTSSNTFLIQTDQSIHRQAGGIGANWHAMGPHAFWYDGLIGRRNRNSRGSAWGGNPPTSNTQAWEDILQHALWLGFTFFRIEIDTRMFQPERRKFDFENEEMQTLYRQLDHCQKHGLEVFLTHQHQDVVWNAHPGISRVQSSPRSVEDFSYGFTKLVQHLIQTKRYTCIQWVCLSNEPGFPGCWWIGADGKPDSVMPAVRAVRKALDKAGLKHIPISGPDWCNLRQDSADFDPEDAAVGCYDGHQYGTDVDVKALADWAKRARSKGYPFFLSEFGSWVGENPFEDNSDPLEPSLRSYDAQLVNAKRVLSGLNLGVDGFNRWSFVNRGDLDGQFQLLRTWDHRRWEYLQRVEPEPVPYFAYGILSRFLPKHATVLAIKGASKELLVSAVRSEAGELTIYVLNQGPEPQRFTLELEGCDQGVTLHQYQVTEKSINKAGFELNPIKAIDLGPKACRLTATAPSRSINTYSTYHLKHSDTGIIAE